MEQREQSPLGYAATEGTQEAWLELCRVATEEDESQMKEIKERTPLESPGTAKFLIFPLFLRDIKNKNVFI